MEIYELHPVTPQKRFIDKAVEVMRSGGVIIYPTDTVYGFGCDIFNKEALDRIFSIKNESSNKLLSFVCPDLKDIAKYAKVSDFAYKTMKHLLPGAYTFILPAAKEVPKKLWSKRKTVGIRIPDNQIAISLTLEMGNPIISSSVTNRLGDVLTDPAEIESIFGNQVDLLLSAGILGAKPSSIIDLSTDIPEVLRIGVGDVSMFQ